jgi:hypothetical protein
MAAVIFDAGRLARALTSARFLFRVLLRKDRKGRCSRGSAGCRDPLQHITAREARHLAVHPPGSVGIANPSLSSMLTGFGGPI